MFIPSPSLLNMHAIRKQFCEQSGFFLFSRTKEYKVLKMGLQNKNKNMCYIDLILEKWYPSNSISMYLFIFFCFICLKQASWLAPLH